MTAAPAPRLRRTTFTTSRLAEFCSQRELTAQTGHPITDWPLVVVKELADNGLDIAEESGLAPEIEISVSTQDGEIIVADNGPGMPAETIASILDYSTRTSSREAYVSPTRGAQGNALKTLLAMPYALDGNRGETLIESQGVAHRIVFSVNQLRQEPQLEHDTTSSLVKTGTRITLQWPESASWILEAADNRFLQIADDLVFLNPHLSIRASWNGEPDLDWPATNPQWHKWRACDPTSPHWYDLARLERLAGAYINDDRKNGRLDRTLRAFVAEFRGLAATAKQKAVLDELGAARSSLASYSFDGAEQEANHDANYRLLAAMRAYSEPDNKGYQG
jgi:hypothetical protein